MRFLYCTEGTHPCSTTGKVREVYHRDRRWEFREYIYRLDMEKELLFSILTFIITLWNIIVYWKWIVRWDIVPHPFTYGIWVIILSIASIELIQNKEILWSIAIIALTLSCLWCLIWWGIHWKKIQSNWLDWFFLFAGMGLIIFWKLEPNYTYVLWVIIAIDATAYASSFKKAWFQPFTEKSFPYFISVGSNIFTIFSISVWNFENLGLWLWTAGINFIFACFILARQYNLRKWP